MRHRAASPATRGNNQSICARLLLAEGQGARTSPPCSARRQHDEGNPKVVNGERTTLADAIDNMLQTRGAISFCNIEST